MVADIAERNKRMKNERRGWKKMENEEETGRMRVEMEGERVREVLRECARMDKMMRDAVTGVAGVERREKCNNG